ncbi:hypothetical protein JW977_02955 [Candidatus Falkowbacteria bacterium]|nr:hypothetical protein [Candidatus Falkowbacteria bacterium]
MKCRIFDGPIKEVQNKLNRFLRDKKPLHVVQSYYNYTGDLPDDRKHLIITVIY